MVEADVIGGPEQLLTSGRAVKLLVWGLEVDTRLMAEVAEPICADRLTCTFDDQPVGPAGAERHRVDKGSDSTADDCRGNHSR